MEFYKPLQYLSFHYVCSTNTLFIKSSSEVLIDKEETLGSYADFPPGSMVSNITLGVCRNDIQPDAYIKDVEVLMKVDLVVPRLPFDPVKEEDNFREGLRKVIVSYFKENRPGYYTVIATVVKIDGTKGGKATNTISSSGEIEIVS